MKKLLTALLFSFLLVVPATAWWTTSGGTLTYYGAYTVAMFKTNGTLTVNGSLNASVLIIGGGGGGGRDIYATVRSAGGGGAGGLIYVPIQNLTHGTYTVTIGNGGIGGVNSGSNLVNGFQGENTSFLNYTAVGGGAGMGHTNGGGPFYYTDRTNGGSGGGSSTTALTPGTGVAGQGFAGGNGSGGAPYSGGGGGGGAGGPGANTPDNNNSGVGGSGLNYTINGTNVNYSTGGAGAGGPSAVTGAAGVANTGNGGGGSRGADGGAGGAGVVIIRYLTETPTTINVTITPTSPNVSSTLNCSAVPTDGPGPYNLSFSWYKNGVLQAYNGNALNCANNTACWTDTLVPSTALVPNDNWSCSARSFDGFAYSMWSSSANKTIANIPPTISNVTIYPASPNTTSTLNCSAIEANSLNSNWCYQETANISTTCGGLATGSYALIGSDWDGGWPATNTIDGDWSTYGNCNNGNIGADCAVYTNYSKPSLALPTSLWQVKNGATGYTNISIPLSCWNQTKLILEINPRYQEIVDYKCWNGASWTVLYQSSGGGENWIYEESMWWNQSQQINFSWYKNGTSISNSTVACLNNTACWNNVTVSSLSPLSNYSCSAQAFDGYNFSTASNTTVTIADITKPNVFFVSPTQNTTATSRNGSIAVNVTCTDDSPFNSTINVTLYLNGSLLYANSSTLGTFFINYTSLANGNYAWNATCTDTSGNRNQTETRATALDASIYPPNVSIPAAATAYSGVINITYTDASWPNGTTTRYFNLTLVNTSGGVVKTILANNSANLSYAWNSTGTANGLYQVRVTANNTINQTATGYSGTFFLENTLIGNCSGNNKLPIANFSILDENTLTAVNATTNFQYTECLVGYANSCHSALLIVTNQSTFSFCSNDTATRTINFTAIVSTPAGLQRTTALNGELWNTSPVTNYTLYVDSAARFVSITVNNFLGQGVPIATVAIYRTLNSTVTLVTSVITDGNGHTGTFLTANTVVYTFNITSATTAPFSTSQVIACDPYIASCSVTFIVGQTNITQVYPTCQFNNNLDAINISDLPVSSQTNLPKTAWFNITSDTYSLSYAGCGMARVWNGTTNTSYCPRTNITSNHSIACSCVINDPGTFFFYTWYANQGCGEYAPYTRVYTVASNTTGGLLSGIVGWGQTAPVSGWVFYFAGVVIAMLVGGFISRFTIDGAGVVAWLVLAGWSVLWLDAPVLPALGLLGTAASLTIVTGLVTGAAVYYHYTGG